MLGLDLGLDMRDHPLPRSTGIPLHHTDHFLVRLERGMLKLGLTEGGLCGNNADSGVT